LTTSKSLTSQSSVLGCDLATQRQRSLLLNYLVVLRENTSQQQCVYSPHPFHPCTYKKLQSHSTYLGFFPSKINHRA
jgi:hypothetical protein